MKKLILLLILMTSTTVWAEEPIRGNVHAVINPDGSIYYYMRAVESSKLYSPETSISKKAIAKFLVGDAKSVQAFEILRGTNKAAGFYMVPKSQEQLGPIELAMDQGFTTKAVSYDALPESFTTAFKFTDQRGKVGGVWISNDPHEGVSTVGKIIPIDWSTSQIARPAVLAMSKADAIPVPREDFIASLRKSMLSQAISLACKSRVVPKEISVTASLAASVGFIVGGEGSISFTATWETAQLCKP